MEAKQEEDRERQNSETSTATISQTLRNPAKFHKESFFLSFFLSLVWKSAAS